MANVIRTRKGLCLYDGGYAWAAKGTLQLEAIASRKGRSFKNGLLPKNPKLEAGVAMSSIFKKQNLTAS